MSLYAITTFLFEKCTQFFIKRKNSKENSESILSYLANSMNASEIEIDYEGIANDKFLTKKEVVKDVMDKIITNPYRGITILVFMSCVVGNKDTTSRMLRLLQVCSTLGFEIHYVDDIYGEKKFIHFKKFLTTRQLRCDKIIKYEDSIVIKELGQYDVIFHPYAGLSSSYEIMVGIIKELKEMHTT